MIEICNFRIKDKRRAYCITVLVVNINVHKSNCRGLSNLYIKAIDFNNNYIILQSLGPLLKWWIQLITPPVFSNHLVLADSWKITDVLHSYSFSLGKNVLAESKLFVLKTFTIPSFLSKTVCFPDYDTMLSLSHNFIIIDNTFLNDEFSSSLDIFVFIFLFWWIFVYILVEFLSIENMETKMLFVFNGVTKILRISQRQ